jgi:hypothetical protein
MCVVTALANPLIRIPLNAWAITERAQQEKETRA